MDALTFIAAPSAMCFVLIGIHCYLGLHVLARGVIFVDLSLAQVAALGATVALACGVDHESPSVYFWSLEPLCLLLCYLQAHAVLRKKFHKKLSLELFMLLDQHPLFYW